jgi:hypothetical protein
MAATKEEMLEKAIDELARVANAFFAAPADARSKALTAVEGSSSDCTGSWL